MEKGLEVFYWYCIPTGLAWSVLGLIPVIGKKARVPLRISAILVYKKGDAKFQRFKWKTRVSRLRSISGRRYW